MPKYITLLCCMLSCQAYADYQGQLLEVSKVWDSTIADYNNDRHDDILINGHDPNDRIWYWTPTGYTPSAQVLRYSDRHGCDAADVNQDGLIDLFCEIGAEKGSGKANKELWLQQSNGALVLKSNFGAEDPYGRGRRPVFFNLNHDAFPDLYATNWSTIRPDGQPNINHTYLNNADGQATFSEVQTDATGRRGSLCAIKGDINHDGWDDILVCNRESTGHIYLNNQANNIKESTLSVFTGKLRWQDAKLKDVNGDGWDDLILLTADSFLQVRLNQKQGRFFGVINFQAHFSNAKAMSVVVGDFNSDGFKDLYVVLQDKNCITTRQDKAPDIIYFGTGTGWTRQQLSQNYAGCGYLADVLDNNKIVLMNGDIDNEGPNYLIVK